MEKNNIFSKLRNLVVNKVLTFATAITLMGTPAIANAENTEVEVNNETEFSLVMQEQQATPMTMVDYSNGVRNGLEYLTTRINYDGLQQDLQCLYSMISREYMEEGLLDSLVENGYVYETNFAEGKYETFARSYNLINVISEFIQSKVRTANNVDELIDISKLCYSEKDAKLVRIMLENYFEAYTALKNGELTIEDEHFIAVFKQLTTLNAMEKAGNADELAVGPRWLAMNVIGNAVMQMLRDHMQETYPRSELDKYFVKEELNKGQWILRSDISLDLNCLKNELEVEVFYFGQLWAFVYDHVNDDIMQLYSMDCQNTK